MTADCTKSYRAIQYSMQYTVVVEIVPSIGDKTLFAVVHCLTLVAYSLAHFRKVIWQFSLISNKIGVRYH